ncbi:MAG: hypothetical protein U0625_10590 [Phycisphaerales bacterium]
MALLARSGRLLRSALLCLAAAAALASAPTARAQGTNGQVPDPISMSELTTTLRRYAQPTPEQLAAIEPLHDAYIQRMKALREGEIERFLAATRKMQGGMPRRQEAEDFIRDYERILKQVAEADDALFASIASSMGEGKAVAINRARDARDRARSQIGITGGMFGQQGRVDVSALVMELKLSPEALAAVDPLLQEYERQYTALSREAATASTRMIRDMFDGLEKAGFAGINGEDLAGDPERMQAMMEAVQTVMRAAGERPRAKFAEIAQLHSKTAKTLLPQLPDAERDRFLDRYVRAAYPQLAMGGLNSPEGVLRLALRSKDLTAEQRTQLEAIRDQWRREDSAALEEGMRAVDAQSNKSSPFDFDAAAQEEYSKTLQASFQKRAEASSKALQAIKALIGDERVQKLAEAQEERAVAGAPTIAAAGGVAVATAEGEVVVTGTEAVEADAGEIKRQTLAARRTSAIAEKAIGVEALQTLERFTDLDQAQRELAATLIGDAEKQWDAQLEPIRAKANEGNRGRFPSSNDAAAQKAADAARASYYEALRDLGRRAEAMDTELLTTLAHALGDRAAAGLQAIRLERIVARSDMGDPTMQFGVIAGQEAQPVDIARLLGEASVSRAERAAAIAAVAADLEATAGRLTQAREDALAAAQRLEDFQQTFSRFQPGENGQPDMAEMQKAGVEMMRLQSQATQAGTRRREAIAATWERILAALPEAPRKRLVEAYEDEAYPTIFRDARAATPLIDRALAMPDLSDDQRTQLLALGDRVRAEHRELSRKMIPKPAGEFPGGDMNAQARYWQEYMDRQAAAQRVQFERDEKSQRAVAALRRILNEAQRARMPELEKYEEAGAKRGQG